MRARCAFDVHMHVSRSRYSLKEETLNEVHVTFRVMCIKCWRILVLLPRWLQTYAVSKKTIVPIPMR